jgi:hypothetical protein
MSIRRFWNRSNKSNRQPTEIHFAAKSIIEVAEDTIDIPEVVVDKPQDDLSEEPVESTDVVLISLEEEAADEPVEEIIESLEPVESTDVVLISLEEEAADESVEVIIEPSEPVDFIVDSAILEEPKKEEHVSIEQHLKNIDGMLKQELDNYALKYGIELDRRQTRPNMVKEFITKLKEKN